MDTARLISALSSAAERDSSVIATLRRSLAFDPGAFAPAFPYLEPIVGNQPEFRRKPAYLVAGLWALCQRRVTDTSNSVSLASALRRVSSQRSSKSIEKRFVALLDSDEDELPSRLRQSISIIAADSIPINWAGLLDDLLRWSHPDRFIQKRWARDYWRSAENSDTQTSNEETETSSSEDIE